MCQARHTTFAYYTDWAVNMRDRLHKPEVVLLLGPIVDAEHPAIASGLLDAPFIQVFDQACFPRHPTILPTSAAYVGDTQSKPAIARG